MRRCFALAAAVLVGTACASPTPTATGVGDWTGAPPQLIGLTFAPVVDDVPAVRVEFAGTVVNATTATVTTPIDGRVLTVEARRGQLLTAGEAVATLAPTTQAEEAFHAAAIAVEQAVAVEAPADELAELLAARRTAAEALATSGELDAAPPHPIEVAADAVTAAVLVTPGQFVREGDPLVALGDPAAIEVRVDVSVADLDAFRAAGPTFVVSATRGDDRVAIARLDDPSAGDGSTVMTETDASETDASSVEVTLRLDAAAAGGSDDTGGFADGDSVRVIAEILPDAATFGVPLEALRTVGERRFVLVERGGTLVRVDVNVVREVDGLAVIAGELEADDRAVMS